MWAYGGEKMDLDLLQEILSTVKSIRNDQIELKKEFYDFRDKQLKFNDEFMHFRDDQLKFNDEFTQFHDDQLKFNDEFTQFRDDQLKFNEKVLKELSGLRMDVNTIYDLEMDSRRLLAIHDNKLDQLLDFAHTSQEQHENFNKRILKLESVHYS